MSRETARSASGTARAWRARRSEDGFVRGTPRRGAKRTLATTLGQIPKYLRLLTGLLTDRRVPGLDKVLVVAAIAYILMPVDLLPDFIPFLGQVDDVYLLVLALQRLIASAGRHVVEEHWSGDTGELSAANLRNVLLTASFFLPRRIRQRLGVMSRA